MGLVTSVKKQKSGTCWTHATASFLKSDFIRTGLWKTNGETGDPNTAEYHISLWMGFNKIWNDAIVMNFDLKMVGYRK